MSDVLERFVQRLLKSKQIRPSDLEHNYGITRTLSHNLFKGQQGPTLSTLKKVLTAYGFEIGIHREGKIMIRQQIFTFFNNAGGVAKTTTAREMAVGMALRGLKVLLIDLDSQGSMSKWMGVPDADNGITLEQTAYAACTVKGAALPTPVHCYGVDVIPSSVLLAQLDMGLSAPALLYLRRNLNAYREHYDYILIDSPPSLASTSQICALACDGLVIPMTTDAKSIEGYNNILEFKNRFGDLLPGGEMTIAAHIATKHEERTATARAMLELIQQNCIAAPLLGPLDTYAIYGRAIASRKPVLLLEPAGSAAKQLRVMIDGFIAATQLPTLKSAHSPALTAAQ